MKTVLSVLGICMVLSGCCPLTSQNPLGGPDAAAYDERLTGSWEAVPVSDERLFFHMGRGEDHRIHIVAVEQRADGRINHTNFAVSALRVAEGTYIDLDLAQLEKEISLDNKGYIILRYDLPDPDTLLLWHMDIQEIASAVKARELSGDITYTPNPTVPAGSPLEAEVKCVRITDTTAKLIQFISRSNAKSLFTHEVRLKRVK